MKSKTCRYLLPLIILLSALSFAFLNSALSDSYGACVISKKLNVRLEMSIKSKSLIRLKKGDRVEVQEYGDDWCKIHYEPKDITGFVMTEFLELDDPVSNFEQAPDNTVDYYQDAPYSTIYPSSLYGVVYRMNQNIDKLLEIFPDITYEYIDSKTFVLDEYGLLRSKFECVIPLEIIFEINDTEKTTTDWKAISLDWKGSDISSSIDQRMQVSLVFMSLFQACDESLSNEEALSIVTILLNNVHSIWDIASKDARQNYNDILYDMYYSNDIYSISIDGADR